MESCDSQITALFVTSIPSIFHCWINHWIHWIGAKIYRNTRSNVVGKTMGIPCFSHESIELMVDYIDELKQLFTRPGKHTKNYRKSPFFMGKSTN